jgi:hypothetical protein
MAEHVLRTQVKDLVLKSNRFNDAEINSLANVDVDDIDVDAIERRASELADAEGKTAIGRDQEWATMLLQSIKTLRSLANIAETDARDRRHADKIGRQPYGQSDLGG